MSTQEQRRRAFQIFEQALDQAPEQRDAFIATACADDAGLRAAVAALQAADANSSINTGGLNAFAVETPSDQLGRVLGHFRLVEHLGSGGMGIVFRGERTDDVTQRAAVKIVRQELRSATRLEGSLLVRSALLLGHAAGNHDHRLGLLVLNEALHELGNCRRRNREHREIDARRKLGRARDALHAINLGVTRFEHRELVCAEAITQQVAQNDARWSRCWRPTPHPSLRR